MNAKTASSRRHARTAAVRFEHLPPAIAAKLRQSVSRVRRILWTRGLLATAATALIAILVIMGIDAAVTIYSSSVRWGLSLAGLAATAVAAVRMLIRPLAQPFSPARIAALIEQRHPELEERLSSVVELLSSPDTVDRGSEQLLQVLTRAAESDARDVAPDQEFTTRTVKPKLVAAGVAFAVLGVLFAAWPNHTGRLLARAVAPYAELDNIYADSLVVTPGDQVMLVGDPLEINLSVTGGFPGQAYVRRETHNERGRRREVVERMRQVESPEGGPGVRCYRQLFPGVDASFRYRIACGHGVTRFYSVVAVDRPEVQSVSLRFAYPAYTGQAPRVLDDGLTEIAAVPGTRVDVVARPNRTDVDGVLVLRPAETPAKPEKDGQMRWTIDVTRGLTSEWGLLLRDAHGFTNLPTFFPARAIPDRVPTIALDRPQQLKMTLPPHARVAMEFTVTDDFGTTVPDLSIALDDAPMKVLRPVAGLAEKGPGIWQGADALDLATLPLSGVRRLRVQLGVADNLPPELGGPQTAQSAVISIELNHDSLSLEAQSLKEQAKNVDETLKEAVERLKESEKAAEEIQKKLEKKEPLNESDQQKLDEVRRDTATAEELVKKLAEETTDTAFKPLAEKLEKLAEEKVTPAREQAEEAQLANPADQPEAVDKLEKKLEEAVKAAEQVLKESQELAKELEKLAEIDELAMREEALADAADEAQTPEQKEDWEKLQAELEAQLKEALADNPEALKNELEERKEELQNLANETKALAKEQEQLQALTQDLAKPETRDEAAKKLEQATPEAPAEATPEQRATAEEKQIAEAAADLAKRADELKQDLQEFGAPTAPVTEPTGEAAKELAKAEEKATEAAGAMAQPPPAPAPGAPPPPPPAALQGEAKKALDQAAAALEKSQQAMEQLMGELEKQALAENPMGELMPAEALEAALGKMEEAQAAAEAAQQPPQPGPPTPPQPGPPTPPQPGPPSMQPAQQAAQQAAQMLQQMAQQAAQKMGVPLPQLPSQQPQPPNPMAALQETMQQARARAEAARAVPDALRGKLSESDWFKLSGQVRSGAMDDALRGVPAEYRELVRMYFRELSRQVE